MVDINNPMSYKNCAKKSYSIYVCMPPEGTVVINKLEQADAVKLLNGRTYFTIKELEQMQSNGGGRFNIISQLISQGRAYLVSKNTPFVLAGTLGELWTISADKLAKTYTFLQNNSVLPINQQTLEKRLVGKYLNWTVVKTSSSATSGQNMACFVPSREKYQIQTSWGAVLQVNGDGVSHGKGDFIVCTKLPNGQPNLNDRWVVNGNIFATTYNNQGWADCLKVTNSNITIDTLPKLFDVNSLKQSKAISKDLFAKKVNTLYSELQKFYKFETIEGLKFTELTGGYTGFTQKVIFAGRTYLASAVVGGSFSLKTEKHSIKAARTLLHFAIEADYEDSAILFSIKPNTSDDYSSGCMFPRESKNYRCIGGTISDINCAEEVARFAKFGNNRDAMIDNRHSKSSVAKPLRDLYNYFKGYDKIKLLEDSVQLYSKSFITYENNCFIFDGSIKGRFSDIEDAKSCIRDVLEIYPKGVFSSFYAPKMSSTTFQALVDYSGSAYHINDKLVDKTALSFKQFLLYTELSEFLSRCKINRHITLFRGMDIDNVDSGTIIPGGNFMSTSLSVGVAESFGSCIFRIKDAHGVNGFFLNSISGFRNSEYEVLLNNEYDIKVGSLFYYYRGYPVYNCSLIKSTNKTVNTSNLADDDSVFMLNLYNSIVCIPSMDTKGIVQTSAKSKNIRNINIFFAKNSKNISRLSVTKDDKKLEVSAKYNGEYATKTELVVNADSEGVTKVLSYIESLIKSIAIASDYSMLVYNRMAQEFTNHGFLVLNDSVDDDMFKLVLTGDNDDKVVVTFNVDIIDDKLRIRVRGKSNGNALDKTKTFDSLDNLLIATYTLIVNSFKLNCANRSDKVINLIARYLGYSVSQKKNIFETLIYYKFGDYDITARIFNTNIEYTIESTGEIVLCSHFDNIHTIASNLYSKLGVRDNDNL